MKKLTKILSLFVMFALALVVVACDSGEVSLSKASLSLEVGETEQLEYTVSDDGLQLVWESSDDSVVEVSQAGLVKALKEGEAIVTVTIKNSNISSSIEITVTPKSEPPVVNPTSVVIIAEVTDGKVGDSWTFVAKVSPLAAKQTVTWETSNPGVATVSETGVVDLVGIGSAFITAKSTENVLLVAEVEITVTNPDPLSITVKSAENVTEIEVDQNLQFSASVSPDLALKQVVWSVDDESKASINQDGLLTALEGGNVKVLATSVVLDTVVGEFDLVIIRPLPKALNVNIVESLISVDTEIQLIVIITPANAVQDVIFTSSNEAVVTVDSTGKLLAVGSGEAKVTIKSVGDESLTKELDFKVFDFGTADKKEIILDPTVTGDRFDEVLVDGVKYYLEFNIFADEVKAFEALEEGSKLVVKEGTYSKKVYVLVDDVTIVGPNEGIKPKNDLSNRLDEAVFTNEINISGRSKVTFDGIKINGAARIYSDKPIKDLTFQYFVAHDIEQPSDSGVVVLHLDTGSQVNENILVKDSYFTEYDAKTSRGFRIYNPKNLTVQDSYFYGFINALRLTGEGYGLADIGTGVTGELIVTGNEILNSNQYPIWIGAYGTSLMEISDNVIAVNLVDSPWETYGFMIIDGFRAAPSGKSIINVQNNIFPQRTEYHEVRINSRNATAEQLEINVNYNVFYDTPAIYSEIQRAHIVNASAATNPVIIDGTNNYFLYTSEVKAEYFVNATYTPYFTELPPAVAEEVSIKGGKEEAVVDEVLNLSANVLPLGSSQDVTWSSNDENIATVSADGVVTFLDIGTVTITVVVDEVPTVKAELVITVGYSPNMLLDKSLDKADGEKFVVNDMTFYYGVTAFKTQAAAFAALNDGSVLHVVSGTYDEAVVLTAKNISILGPNAGVVANKDLTGRSDEAVFSKQFTVSGIEGLLIDGLSFDGAIIYSDLAVKGVTILNSYFTGQVITTNEGVIFLKAVSGTEINDAVVVKGNYFNDANRTANRAVRLENPKDAIIDNNYFYQYMDPIRLEGENAASGGNGYGVSGTLYIRNNTMKASNQYPLAVWNSRATLVEISGNIIDVSGAPTAYQYGLLYVRAANVTGQNMVINIINNVFLEPTATTADVRVHSGGLTNDDLAINVNGNIFHKIPLAPFHIQDVANSANFVINGINNTFLYDTPVLESYFRNTVFKPYDAPNSEPWVTYNWTYETKEEEVTSFLFDFYTWLDKKEVIDKDQMTFAAFAGHEKSGTGLDSQFVGEWIKYVGLEADSLLLGDDYWTGSVNYLRVLNIDERETINEDYFLNSSEYIEQWGAYGLWLNDNANKYSYRFYTGTGGHDITRYFTKINVTNAYNENSFKGTHQVSYRFDETLASDVLLVSNYGHTLSWNTKADGTGDSYDTLPVASPINLVLYAVWTAQ